MQVLGVLMVGLLVVFSFTGLRDVIADADTDSKAGLKYYVGDGVAQDYSAALKWFHKDADQGHQ
jgi:TPR repeat protein